MTIGIRASLGGWTCLALLACNPVMERARSIESRFIGMESRTLRRCLGDAPFFEMRDDGSELWAYTGRLKQSTAPDIEITRALGSGTANQRPRVEAGLPTERSPILSTRDAEENEVPPGSCVYLFIVRDGSIGGYKSRGRNAQDMRADEACTVELQRCVPADAAPAPKAKAG